MVIRVVDGSIVAVRIRGNSIGSLENLNGFVARLDSDREPLAVSLLTHNLEVFQLAENAGLSNGGIGRVILNVEKPILHFAVKDGETSTDVIVAFISVGLFLALFYGA